MIFRVQHCTRLHVCVCVLGVYFLIHASLQNNLMTLDPFQYHHHTIATFMCWYAHVKSGSNLLKLSARISVCVFVWIHTFCRIRYVWMVFAFGFYNRNHSRNKDTADTLIKWWSDNPYAYSLSTSTIYQIHTHTHSKREAGCCLLFVVVFDFITLLPIMRWS